MTTHFATQEATQFTANTFRCQYCGLLTHLVWVHGHGQCQHCKTNVDECCRGENAACKIEPDNNTPETQ